MLTPLLTERDQAESSEGALDPLGLYSIADMLAVRLVPGVRERMTHPRFLTIMALSLSLCEDFVEDEIAKDGVSEPWQVFEWYVVEGLVRGAASNDELRGLPGREKVSKAMKDNVPLCAARYLKNPSVVGFHGVYRLLARDLGIEIAGRLGERGYELLATWAEEQGLEGICGTVSGPGTKWRSKLVEEIRRAMETGAACQKDGRWAGWGFIRDHLAHLRIGPREAKVIRKALMGGDTGFRKCVLEFLVSEEWNEILSNLDPEEPLEKKSHEILLQHSDTSLASLLNAIKTYEQFSSLLMDAFEDCLYEMSLTRDRVRLEQMIKTKSVEKGTQEAPGLFGDLLNAFEPFQAESMRFQESFVAVGERLPPAEWCRRLLDHHKKIQMNKPPNGKAPWFERFDDGAYIVRPDYLRQEGGQNSGKYVHFYRTRSLLSFARDLGMLR